MKNSDKKLRQTKVNIIFGIYTIFSLLTNTTTTQWRVVANTGARITISRITRIHMMMYIFCTKYKYHRPRNCKTKKEGGKKKKRKGANKGKEASEIRWRVPFGISSAV